MKFLQANALSFTCLVVMFLAGLIMYPSLPATLPTQYNMDGVPGNSVAKEILIFIMPVSYACTIFIINFLIRFSPEKFAMQNSQRAMDIIIFGTGVLLLASHLGLMASQGDNAIFQQYLAVGLACFLVIMGNVIGKTERNFIIGIRLPWTLASEQNWRATHRLSGRLMVICGLLLLISCFFFASLVLTLSLGLGWLAVAAVYSFMYYLKNERPTSE